MNKHSTTLYTVKRYKKTKVITRSLPMGREGRYSQSESFHTGCFELEETFYFQNRPALIEALKESFPYDRDVFFYTHLNYALKDDRSRNVDSLIIVSHPLAEGNETLSFNLKKQAKTVRFKPKRKKKHYTHYCDCWRCQKANGGSTRVVLPNEYYS